MRLFIFIILTSITTASFAKLKPAANPSKGSDLLEQRVKEINSEKDEVEKNFIGFVTAKKEDEAVKAIKDDKDYFLVNTKIKDEPVLTYCIKNQLWKIAESLIKNGANLNAKDKAGKVALMYSAEARNKYVTTMLIASKADRTAKDKKGVTAEEYIKTNGMM